MECEVTYTIVAGGTLIEDLVGPRSFHGSIIDACLEERGGK